jgi:hypothetical protein
MLHNTYPLADVHEHVLIVRRSVLPLQVGQGVLEVEG